MSKNFNDICIALAGAVQAVALVEKAAKSGYIEPAALGCSIESLFDLNPPNTLAVYGGNAQNLRLGLETLRELLNGKTQAKDSFNLQNVMRYCLGVLHLEKKLSGRKDMLATIAKRIEHASEQAKHFSSTHENVISNLAGLYSDTISSFKFRIQVIGDYNYLQQARIANQIRALLLAGIRSAILWRQVGGNLWQLLLQRKKMLATIEELLRTY